MTAAQSRERAAELFAQAMGWTIPACDHKDAAWLPTFYSRTERIGRLPHADAPLHTHLAFVGRVAEALGADGFTIDSNPNRVWFRVGGCVGDGKAGEDGDLSLCAMLAATEARKGTP